MIPPEEDAEFVACREEVLETYERLYDPQHPVICRDEQPVQLIRETRAAPPATKQHPQRVDYESERAGRAAVFKFCEPLGGWREASARQRRTKADWALEVGSWMEGRYADCEQVTLVLDRLNAHTQGPFYTAFEAARARELVRRIECCYTPQHGRGLNSAENELSAMTRQGWSGRRIGDLETLRTELAAGSEGVSTRQRGVDWRMKIDDARRKLKTVYSKILL